MKINIEKLSEEEANLLKNIGLRVKDIREKKSLKQSELAEKVKTSETQVRRIEKATAVVSIVTLKRFADALGVSLLALLVD